MKRRQENTAGLSPRVRGNHWERIDTNGIERSIPARAGEPKTSKVNC